jgi:hypothetical protein
MKLHFVTSAVLFLVSAVSPIFANTSYIVLRNSDTDSLIRVSSDGKTVTPIANGAGGLGLAVEASGTYIVAAQSALLRVTRTGKVEKGAEAPPNAEWASLAIDQRGDFIIVDGKLPVLWGVSSNGESITKVATLNAITYPSGGRATAVTVDASGNYLWLIQGIVDHRRGAETQFFSVSPGGAIAEITLKGPRTYSPTSMISDGAGSYLFVDYDLGLRFGTWLPTAR